MDIPLPTGAVHVGSALDGIIRRDQPVLRALSGETAIDLDIAIWFEPANVHPVVFDGDWLSACGREFEIWAEVSHSERDADAPVSPSTDVVMIEWRRDGVERRAQIVEASAERRQVLLIGAVRQAISDGADQVAIELSASQGIAGIVVPADLVAALAANRVTLTLTGHRRTEEQDVPSALSES
ncbi:hypothetical protein ACTJKH_17490 [Microbacterium sp. 22215]|uniref:hypothetical protein n=1 Tax=Microbacterium sp. 22215 TaxID=3453893 RepID=UPI003F846A65